MSVGSLAIGRAVIVAAIAVRLCGGAALAQDTQSQGPQPPGEQPQNAPPPSAPSDPTGAMVGAWEFSNADHDKICRFNFRADTVSGGYKLDIDKNCPNLFPSTKDIVAWAIDNYGSLRLNDARGNAVVELTEVEGGMYDGFTPEEGRYILQTAAAAPVHSAEDMVGDWAVARGTGKPICMLTLANAPAGTDVLALKVKPGCDALITRFGPIAWRIEQGQLVLLAPRGQSWQFEENDANTWQRVPETPDPILLVRQ
jgi:Protease inhibitor Inh